jgi:hypothetical protein
MLAGRPVSLADANTRTRLALGSPDGSIHAARTRPAQLDASPMAGPARQTRSWSRPASPGCAVQGHHHAAMCMHKVADKVAKGLGAVAASLDHCENLLSGQGISRVGLEGLEPPICGLEEPWPSAAPSSVVRRRPDSWATPASSLPAVPLFSRALMHRPCNARATHPPSCGHVPTIQHTDGPDGRCIAAPTLQTGTMTWQPATPDSFPRCSCRWSYQRRNPKEHLQQRSVPPPSDPKFDGLASDASDTPDSCG